MVINIWSNKANSKFTIDEPALDLVPNLEELNYADFDRVAKPFVLQPTLPLFWVS